MPHLISAAHPAALLVRGGLRGESPLNQRPAYQARQITWGDAVQVVIALDIDDTSGDAAGDVTSFRCSNRTLSSQNKDPPAEAYPNTIVYFVVSQGLLTSVPADGCWFPFRCAALRALVTFDRSCSSSPPPPLFPSERLLIALISYMACLLAPRHAPILLPHRSFFTRLYFKGNP